MNYIMVCRRYERVAGVCILDEFEVHKNDEFLEKAEKLKPVLHRTEVRPQNVVVKHFCNTCG